MQNASPHQIMQSKQVPFWILLLSLAFLLIVSILIQDGMFMDGMLYTCVAKNLANGLGSFWFPYFNQMGVGNLSSFHEHPPLVFGIQAIFFKLLGNSIYVERFYSFFTAILAAYLIFLHWQLITKDKAHQAISWLPILFSLITPVLFWSYANNMQENTMSIFTLAAVYFAIKSMKSQNAIPALILSGCFIFLASFSKGIPGFFPLATVAIYGIVHQDISFQKIIGYSLILIAVPITIYGLLLLHDSAQQNLDLYLNARVLKRIGSAPTVDSRFYILGKLFLELVPSILLTALFLLFFYLKKIPNNWSIYKKEAISYALIGLSAAAPMMLTMVQKGFYLVPSFPFFAISLALLVVAGLANSFQKMNLNTAGFQWFKRGSYLVLIVSIIFAAAQIGKTSRDQSMLHDVYLLGEVIPEHTTISVSKALATDWSVHMYFMRNFYISLDKQEGHSYFLCDKNEKTTGIKGFKKLEVATQKYDLFVKE